MATTVSSSRAQSTPAGRAPEATAFGGSATGASTRAPRPLWWRVVRAVLIACGAVALVGSPWWGPLALARLDYFHVRRVEFEGLRYAKGSELLRLIAVDTTQSVWQPLPPLGARVATHPLVAEVDVVRRLPGTLLVRVTEREPVALAPIDGILRPADVRGRALPIDPTQVPLDVPILAGADTVLLRVLDALRQHAPALYARVTEARRAGPDELHIMLGSLRIRTAGDVTVSRFRDILPVEADLARNQLRVVELDLRFRDQVIARQP